MKGNLPKVLITGSNGQLGASLRHHPLAHEFAIIACPREKMDITDIDSIRVGINTDTPDIVINTAAFTAVDKAEQELNPCNRVNNDGARNVAIICQKNNIPLIHLSTDYVFDGVKNSPYLEDDQPNPISVYGQSKWLGEESVRGHCDHHIILRLTAVFSTYGNNFVKKILQLAKEKAELHVVTDQIICPTYAGDIAGAIYSLIKLLTVEKKNHWGTYHYSSFDGITWHQFATMIIQNATIPLLVKDIFGIASSAAKHDARRPAYSVLNCNKIKKDYGLMQPTWQNNLLNVIASITS